MYVVFALRVGFVVAFECCGLGFVCCWGLRDLMVCFYCLYCLLDFNFGLVGGLLGVAQV